MTQQMLDEYAREKLAEIIVLGRSILSRLPNRQSPRDKAARAEKLRTKVREAELELQACQPHERREFLRALDDTRADHERAQRDAAHADELDYDIDAFGGELSLLWQQCNDRHKDDLKRLGDHASPAITASLQADGHLVNHIGTAWSNYRCPNPESAEALDDDERRLSRLLERLQSIVDKPEREYRAQLVSDALLYGIGADGLSNVELSRRIDQARWAELARS